MSETECSSFAKSTALAHVMDIKSQDEKDISKVFNILRAKLNAKEKELLELQRAEPCLLAPDSEQINSLLDGISALHLSTQDGSFIFASDSSSDRFSSTSVCSTGVDSIKTLPNTIWLPESTDLKKQEEQQINQYRLPMVTHLFSLPANAFLASSSNLSTQALIKTKVQPKDEPINRLPMVSHLLSMPIDAFKSSSNNSLNQEHSITQIDDKKQTMNNDNKILSSSSSSITTTESPKSILNTEKIYSKEYWLGKTSTSESESTPLDLDKYIEQTTEKMRRLHMEYIEALEKLKTPSNPVDSSAKLKSMSPQMFDQLKSDVKTKTSTNISPSKK